MPVVASGASVRLAAVAVLCAVACAACLHAQESDNSADLDLFVYSQQDDGGNPIQNERMLYYGARAAVKLKVNKVLTIRPSVTVSILDTGGKAHVPDTITNATITSASQGTSSRAGGGTTYVPVTTSMGFDIKPPGSDWTLSPSAFFSYQDNYISRGLDFSASVELFNGNFIPSISYGFRWDSLSSKSLGFAGVFGAEGEGGEGGEEDDGGGGTPSDEPLPGSRLETRFTQNLQLGFTQILSPMWRLNASFQYTRQDGFLGAPGAVVALYDDRTPVLFANEKLPSYRDRFQFNTRVRFAPALGWGLGMDHSFYADDWGIYNFAVEPSVEGPFYPDIARWRVWYRYSYQHGTRFKRGHPQHEYRYQTDDPDLGTFSTQGGGALFLFDLATWGKVHWKLRVTGYGVTRSDGIWGFGGLIGTEFDW
ncbi:MAG: DUF3570 domain-containing protein [Planctomycetes bacterium]|nr:DUF3570 domain-containing protein [Planctomycetota bacterium]